MDPPCWFSKERGCVLEAVCGGGSAGVHRRDGRTGYVVEVDESLIVPLSAIGGERDGVGELLGSRLEVTAAKVDEGEVAGGVTAVGGFLPRTDADAALAWEEGGIGRGFSDAAATGEHEQ